MLHRTLLFAAFLLATTPFAAAQGELKCSGAQPVNLCCQALNPYSANAYVWDGPCGNKPPSNMNIPVGSDCSMNVPNWYARASSQ